MSPVLLSTIVSNEQLGKSKSWPRLAAIGGRLGLATSLKNSPFQNPDKEAKPIVSGIVTFPKSID
jgi:hypothetical protein